MLKYMKKIDLDGPVHYLDFGGDGPPMVLVHGLGGSSVNWLAVGPALAGRARVLAIDLLGFGRTPLRPGNAPSSIDANVALLARFIREVAGGPACVVGNSMGGLVSLVTAADHADLVTGLVLVAPALPRVARAALDHRVAALFVTYLIPGCGEMFLAMRQMTQDPEQGMRQILVMCGVDVRLLDREVYGAHLLLAQERRGMRWANPAFLSAARSVMRMLGPGGRFRAALQGVRARTLLMHGTADRVLPLAGSQAVALQRPDWTLSVLDGVGHVPQLEIAERFVALVQRWSEAREA